MNIYITEEDLQKVWAAGFMDGEGTITIKRVKQRGYIYHQPYITCAQTLKGNSALKILKDIFGGSLYIYRQKGQRIDTVQWTIVSKDAMNCAKTLYPYLVLKKKQAEIIMRFYDEKEIYKYKMPMSEIKRRENMFIEMRKLNVKGKIKFQLQRLNEETPKGEATV